MKRLLLPLLAVTLAVPLAVAAIAPPAPITGGDPSPFAREEIPGHLLVVYVAAAYDCPGLPWQVLAAIGWVESRHGGGRVDPVTGDTSPPIIGPAIDGRPGFAAIPDPTSPDGWAHAVGPMQFLTTTFNRWGVVAPDRPPHAAPDAQNAWDAIHSAAAYLCAGRPELDDLDAAILRYNRSQEYLRDVLDKAAAYGLGRAPADADLASGSGEAVVAAAMTQLGVPYVWGDETPGVGFDCSGLVQWAYAQIGVALPRTTSEQINVGIAADLNDLRIGDLVFSASRRPGGVVNRGHVAIYVGGGQVIVAPKTGDVIRIRPLVPGAVQAVRRVLT